VKVRQRLRRLDERSVVARMQLDQVEIFAPFNALIAVAAVVEAGWQALAGHGAIAVIVTVIAVVEALVSVAGYRRRRRRDRREDPWQPM
jgi:hypothetical protein